MAINKIVRNSITGDAVDATKLADDAVSEEHLDVTAITGNAELSAASADDDVLLVFDTSAGVIKKVQRSNVALSAPTFTSVSPTNANTGDGTGNHTFVITGTKFDSGATAVFINTTGTTINPTSSTRNSATQITLVIAKSAMPDSGEPYDVKILNGNGLNVVGENQININASPVYVTSAGTLGTVTGGSAISTIDVVAADPESAGNVSFEIQSGALSAGLSSATVNENGVSKFRITGTPTNPAANTTTNFVLRAVDAASNTTSRAFSITVNRSFTTSSFTSSGTFAVPSGVTSLANVLVVAGGGGGGSGNGTSGIGGGGGGAGGLVFMPCHPVQAGTITVTVGCGGAGFTSHPSPGTPPSGGAAGQDSAFGAPGDPGFSPTSSVLTAKGGGTGGSRFAGSPTSGVHQGNSGGSGGGGSAGYPALGAAGTATQSTQSGNSGAYGFGNNGGTGGPGNCNQSNTSGGGGGAGAVGINGNPSGPSCGTGGQGGTGKAYTIADGTSSVFYAGGGGGGRAGGNPNRTTNTVGGQGGGGNGGTGGYPTGQNGQAGTANTGGGGGGGGGTDGNIPAYQNGKAGGKGIVIVRY